MYLSFLLAQEPFNATQEAIPTLAASVAALAGLSSAIAGWRASRASRRRRETEVRAVEDMLSTLRERREQEKEISLKIRRAPVEAIGEEDNQPSSANSVTKAPKASGSEGADSTPGLAASFNSEIDALLTNQLSFYVEHIKGGQRQTNYHRIISLVAIVGGLLVIFGAVIGTLLGAISIGITSGALGTLATGIGAVLFQQAKSAEMNSISDFDKVRNAVEEADRLKNAVRLAIMINDEKRREYIFETLALKLAIYNKTEDASDSFISEILTNRPTRE